MAKYILEQAGNINWMAVFSLMTFMIIFITGSVLILRKNDHHIQHMAQLPLDEDNEQLN